MLASPRGFGRNSKKICLVSNGRNIILISFGINHHLSQIQCTQTCNSTQAEGSYLSWQQDVCCGWFDTMFNPCFVCFVKNLPIEKTDLTDLTCLGCLADVIFRCHPGKRWQRWKFFGNNPRWNPCMDYDSDYDYLQQGGKMGHI